MLIADGITTEGCGSKQHLFRHIQGEANTFLTKAPWLQSRSPRTCQCLTHNFSVAHNNPAIDNIEDGVITNTVQESLFLTNF